MRTLSPKRKRQIQSHNISMYTYDNIHNTYICNNVNNNNNNVYTILDNESITSQLKQCPNFGQHYAICKDCDSVWSVPVACKKKTCPYCQKQRGRRLFEKYASEVQAWHPTQENKINFLTLTFKNVPEINKEYLDNCDLQVSKFRRTLQRRGLVVRNGFVSYELTWTLERGYHYHAHLLFYSPYIDLKKPETNLSDIWREITKGESYIVKLYSKFLDGHHALRYILKYICKPEISDEGTDLYRSLRPKHRDFQTFGKGYGQTKRKTPEKIRFCCPSCGGDFKRAPGYGVLYTPQQVNKRYDLIHALKISYNRLRLRVEMEKERIKQRNETQNKFDDNELEIILTRQAKLLTRISPYLEQEQNALIIEEILTPEDLQYLLENGSIYHATSETYKELI